MSTAPTSKPEEPLMYCDNCKEFRPFDVEPCGIEGEYEFRDLTCGACRWVICTQRRKITPEA